LPGPILFALGLIPKSIDTALENAPAQASLVIGGDRERGLWERTAPPAPDTPRLAQDVTADVAIIGGGFTGLSAALHLAQRAARVVTLEAQQIGHGAAGRNVGLVNAGMWVAPDELVSVLGSDPGERLLHLLDQAPQYVCELIERHGIECELERAGTLQCAVGARGLALIRERARQMLRRGAHVELIDAARTAQLVGSEYYGGALFDHRTATVQPLAYARGLGAAALAAGARIYTESRVLAVEKAGTGYSLRTANGSVKAPWIIVATDAYGKGPWPEVERELIHLPYFNVATQPLPEEARKTILAGGQGVADTRMVLSSVRLDRSGRLIVGSIGALGGLGGRLHVAWARRAIRRLFPQIGELRLEHAWYGSIGMTDTNLPKFHRLAPQVLSISGYNGRGIAAGTGFGRLLAELITGEISESDIPLPFTAPGKPALRALRTLSYEVGAQLTHVLDAWR
jgi:glycine/D-amino acid oxidase-like deaminating enzyme